jgi:heat shock protein HslJ
MQPCYRGTLHDWSKSMTSTRRLVHLTALFSALALAACGGTLSGPSAVPTAPPASLAIETNAVWHLRAMADANGTIQAIEDPSLFTLMLTDDGKVTARVDCNRASGGYTISGNVLSIGPLASTKAYCGTASFDWQFLTLLGGQTTVTASGATLQLLSPRGTMTFDR